MLAWILAIFVLGLLVMVHELGHFLVAKRFGVKVLRFSIGFGPVVSRWQRGETEYVLSLLPLGGYVKMAGEQHDEQSNDPREFLSQPAGVRAWIIAAGPMVNYATSILSLWVVLMVGYPELLPSVGRLMDDMPAKSAGFQVGDRIRDVDGQKILTWDQLTTVIHGSAGKTLHVQVERGGQPVALTVTPSAKEQLDPFGRRRSIGLLGIAPNGAFETYRLAPIPAVKETAKKQKEWISQMGLSLWAMFTGRVPMQESLTGPIGIMYMTSEAVRMGLGALLYLVSIFSLSLAVFNAFPIPVLDGGHLFFLLFEKLRGRPVSMKVQEKAMQVSTAVLMVLVVLVCVNDLSRLGVIDKVKSWWQ